MQTITQLKTSTEAGSLVIDFSKLTQGGLSSLRYLLESEATKNTDYAFARMCFEAARDIHEIQTAR